MVGCLADYFKLASSGGQSKIAPSKKPTSLQIEKLHNVEAERQTKDSNQIVTDNKTAITPIDQARSILARVKSRSEQSQNLNFNSSCSWVSKSPSKSKKSFENCKEFLKSSTTFTTHTNTRTGTGNNNSININDNKNKNSASTPFTENSSEEKNSLKSKGFPSSKSLSNLSCKNLVEGKAKDLNCLTSAADQCVDEVEIVSLLEEQIPRYKLRADTITKFSGYSNEDFVGIPYPVLKDYTPVTPEQAFLTLGYFLLSGERLSSMTKTFSDPDALQRLLEEKEKDLELAARIGQQLLEQNQNLEEKVAALEEDLKESIDQVSQLKHELVFKSQLLELYNDSCCSEEQSKVATPMAPPQISFVLEKRVHNLEQENSTLRAEACQMIEDVEKTESEEKYLIEDAIKRLGESNSRLTYLREELQKKTEESIGHEEEIRLLLEELKAYQEANQELVDENCELNKIVVTLKESQEQLATDILDLKENYMEVVAILKETQEQLKEAQKRKESGDDVISVFDSLAYEIESSVAKQRRSSDYFRRTFDTVRCANSKINDSASGGLASSNTSSLGYHSGLASLDTSVTTTNNTNEFQHNQSLQNCSELDSSICSAGSTPASECRSWRFPEKLQIVKPIEGSSTLHIWSQMAQPHLGGLLEKRPGVQTRIERPFRPSDVSRPGSSGLNLSTISTNVVGRNEPQSQISSTNLSKAISSSSLASSSAYGSCSESSISPLPPSSLGSIGDLRTLGTLTEAKCETPTNSPINSRPASPTAESVNENDTKPSISSINLRENNQRTLNTLKIVYDTLWNSLGGITSTRTLKNDFTQKPNQQKCDLMSKIGSIELAFNGTFNGNTYIPPETEIVLNKIINSKF